MQTKLPLNGTIQHPDLAEALRGESGTFFCQQGGQGYIVTAAEGFSIKSLRPVGRKIVEANVLMTARASAKKSFRLAHFVLVLFGMLWCEAGCCAAIA
jgi:hypothetical protein